MPPRPAALVVGAGIGGLAAAIGLERAGFRTEVLERSPELAPVGAGLSLWPNAVRALRELGLEGAVVALAQPEVEGGMRTWRGDLLVRLSAAEMDRRYGAPAVAVHRADLQAALIGAYGGALRLGARVTSFEEDKAGVAVRLANGGVLRGDLLVGADGLRSAVRAQLHGEVPPTYAGYTAWRAVLPFPAAWLTPGESLGRGARFGQVPLRDGRVYWFATKNGPEGGRSADGEKAELLRTFRGWHDPVEALIAATDEGAILRNDIYDRPPLRAWGRGRVTLLGDAAHPMTPNLGQGACQALEDAAVLARCLRGRADVAGALRAYEAQRIPRTAALVRQSRAAGQVGQWGHPLAVGLRTALFRHVMPHLLPRQLDRTAGYAF